MRSRALDLHVPAGSSPKNPVPLGFHARVRIERGDLYGVPDVYELKLRILSVLAGRNALKEIGRQTGQTVPPSNEKDYMLIQLEILYAACGTVSGAEPYEITEDQFVVWKDNREYEVSSLSLKFREGLIGMRLSPGSICTGWLAFELPKRKSGALLLFKYRNLAAVQRWRYVFLKLKKVA